MGPCACTCLGACARPAHADLGGVIGQLGRLALHNLLVLPLLPVMLLAHRGCPAVQEIDELCDEWQPEPLAGPLPAAQSNFEPPVIHQVGCCCSSQQTEEAH